VPCLLGERRSIPPFPFEAMWNSLMESPIMAHSGDGGPPQYEPMTVASEPSFQGGRLRLSKQSALNSWLPKQMVSPREKPSHGRRSQSTATASANDGTIGMSRGNVCCKSPFLAGELLVFSASTRIRWSRLRVLVLRWSCKLQST
jgi:hypothetical protein